MGRRPSGTSGKNARKASATAKQTVKQRTPSTKSSFSPAHLSQTREIDVEAHSDGETRANHENVRSQYSASSSISRSGSVDVYDVPLSNELGSATTQPSASAAVVVVEDIVTPPPSAVSAHVCSNSQQEESVTCVSDSDTDVNSQPTATTLTELRWGIAEMSAKKSVSGAAESTALMHTFDVLSDSGDLGDDVDAEAPVNSCFSRASAAASAPILGVSRLTDYFTYGVQAALRHYADHFHDDADNEEEAEEGMNGSHPAVAHDRNAFLSDQPSSAPSGAGAAHGKPATTRSSSSSAATYDSDAEADNARLPTPPQVTEHFLEPQQTSLYLAPPSSNVAHSRAGPSWSGMVAASSSASALPATTQSNASVSRKPSKVPVSEVAASRDADWRAGHVQACFREALRRAYRCEDAMRQRRFAEVDQQRTQLIRTLSKLQGGNATGNGASVLEPRRGRPSKVRLNLAQPQSPPPSSLSALAEYAGEAREEEGEREVTGQTRKVPVGRQQQRRGAATAAGSDVDVNRILYATDDAVVDTALANDITKASMGAVAAIPASAAAAAAPPRDPSSRLLQVMHPSQIYKLRRTPNMLVNTLLKHHQEAQLKQRAAHHSEVQAVHVRRLYELPVLTEDVVRYVALLLCLKRSHRRPLIRSAPSAAAAGSESAERPSSPSPAQAASTTLMTAFPSPDAMPPYGEEGSLLYMKYPAPLLRTTSFAVETVRLLKWLRTWKGSSSSGYGGGAANFSPSPPTSLTSTVPTSAQQRKRVKVEVSEARPAKGSTCSDGADVQAAGSLAETAAVALPPQGHRTTVETLQRQLQMAQEASEAQAKQQKKAAFLNFFGAAAATKKAVKAEKEKAAEEDEEEKKTTVAVADVSHEEKSVNVAEAKNTKIKTEQVSAPAAKDTVKVEGEEEEEEQIVVQQPQTAATALAHASPPNSSLTLLGSSTPTPSYMLHPPLYAYQLYCYAWRHAVKTGITPLATAAQAFAGTRHTLLNNRADGERAYSNAGDADARSGKAVSRVCAALPFYKEMQEEAQRTALGSAAKDVYYEDAFGNRLRSARLAQKEQEKLEQMAAQQRRRAKKKGYFHRDDAEATAASSAAAAAMLEAMRSPLESTANGSATQRRTNKRRRERVSSSSGSESDGSDVLSAVCISDCDDEQSGKTTQRKTQRSKGNATQKRQRGRSESVPDRSGGDDRLSDGSSSGSVSEAENGNEANAKDEITNIAVVSGPTGSGKTAAVYVAAQLLGFRVVEMNASVRRCSKSVELLLAELTRSHRLSGLRPGAAGFNAEEELNKLKQQHAAMMEKARAEAAAAEREAEQKRKEARKANGISAQAVANFFSKTPAAGKSSGSRSVATSAAAARGVHGQETTNVDDAADEVEEGGKVGGDVVTSVKAGQSACSTISPPPPLLPSPSPAPTQTPSSAAAAATRTLLLFEDADILLGDESAKSFYAAIRDLAHRSKVPIVVTVSADPSASQRYDTPLFPQDPAMPPTRSVLPPTYWQLCEQAGVNSAMNSLEAAYTALQASPVLTDRSGDTVTNGGGGVGVDSAGAHSGGNSPSNANVSAGGGTATSSLLSFLSPSNTIASAAGASTSGNGPTAGNVGSSSLHGYGAGASGGGSASSPAAAAAATRYTHMLLNASLVSTFFGSQTPFTVVDALPPSALFAQLLAVGAVELGLFQWPPTSPAAQPENASPFNASIPTSTTPSQPQQHPQFPSLSFTPSSSSWQQDLEQLTGSLTLRDPVLFFRLAGLLCEAIFGVADDANTALPHENEDTACGERKQGESQTSPCAAQPLSRSVQADAASRSTTDIRYWLNRLQLLLFALQAPQHAPGEDARDDDSVHHNTVSAAENGFNSSGSGGAMDCASHRQAERLLESDFQQRASLAASEWDGALGRYRSLLTHNELHSSRYEYWLLDDHVDYATDIVGELHTHDHPTLRIDYSTTPSTSSTPHKRGRSSTTAASKKTRHKAAAVAAASSVEVPNVASAAPTVNTAGGLNAAWKSFFGGPAGASTSSTPAVSSPSSGTPPRLAGGQQTLFGFPRTPITGAGGTGATSAAFDMPARYEWPPSVTELRRQMNSSAARLRPVELLLPYSTAQSYYDGAATTASAGAFGRVHHIAEPSPLLLGHDTPLRFVNRQGGREEILEEGDLCEVSDALPADVYTTQEERFAVFRQWWKRTRKVGALRDSVAGRSAEALEDMLGFGCLLAPPTSAASSSGNAAS